jgi:hypothetical protein
LGQVTPGPFFQFAEVDIGYSDSQQGIHLVAGLLNHFPDLPVSSFF